MEATVSRSIRVGLFFLFGLALIWIVHETFTESNLYSEYGYPVRAPFEDLKQLKNGSDVRLAGVSIGAVTETKLDDGQALAVLSIEPDFLIPVDSIAMITTAGLLGNNYVTIEMGKEERYLRGGDTMRTREAPDLNKVIGKVGDLGDKISKFIEGITGDEAGDLLGPLNNMIEDMRPKIDTVLNNMVSVSERLLEQEGTLGKLINDDEAYRKFVSAADGIGEAANDARDLFSGAKDAVDKLGNGEGPLDFVLNDKHAADQLRQSVANINEFSSKLNDSNSSLGKLISDDGLYNRADSVLSKVEGAVENVENSGPVSAVGVVSSALF